MKVVKNSFSKLLFTMFITLMLFSGIVVVSAEPQDNIDVFIQKNMLTIQGTTVKGYDDVTIQIIRKDDGKRVYIDQVKTDESGQFVIETVLDKGRYSLIAVSSGNRFEKGFEVVSEGNSGGNNGGSSGGSGGSGGNSGSGSRGSSGGSSGGKTSDKEVKHDEQKEQPRKTFSDIDNFPWAKEAIEEVTTKGIMLEVNESIFAPEINITRGEFIGALIRALGLTDQTEENFIDISITHPYYEEIKAAKALGIAKGVGNNRLDPDAFITRQDMMVLIERALRITGKLGDKKADLTYLDQFEDKGQISDYAREAVALMVELGFIKGDGKNINPKGFTTRAEAAVVLFRLMLQ